MSQFNISFHHFSIDDALFSPGVSRKTPSESMRLAECIGNARCLLWKVLAESQRHLNNFRGTNNSINTTNKFIALAEEILAECHKTFVACFHAFYPTGNLKWACLCDLLGYIEPVSICSYDITIKLLETPRDAFNFSVYSI